MRVLGQIDNILHQVHLQGFRIWALGFFVGQTDNILHQVRLQGIDFDFANRQHPSAGSPSSLKREGSRQFWGGVELRECSRIRVQDAQSMIFGICHRCLASLFGIGFRLDERVEECFRAQLEFGDRCLARGRV